MPRRTSFVVVMPVGAAHARFDAPRLRDDARAAGRAGPVPGGGRGGDRGEPGPVRRGDAPHAMAGREADDAGGVAAEVVDAAAGEGVDVVQVGVLAAQERLLVLGAEQVPA